MLRVWGRAKAQLQRGDDHATTLLGFPGFGFRNGMEGPWGRPRGLGCKTCGGWSEWLFDKGWWES